MFKIKRLLFLVIILLLTSCSKEPIHNQTLEKAISAEMEKEETTEIHIGDHTDFPWDKAFVFTPYTSNETIQEQLDNSDIDSNFKSNIEYLDSFNLIIFIEEDKVVQYAEIPRTYGDLMLEKGNVYTPDNDLVQIRLHKE